MWDAVLQRRTNARLILPISGELFESPVTGLVHPRLDELDDKVVCLLPVHVQVDGPKKLDLGLFAEEFDRMFLTVPSSVLDVRDNGRTDSSSV